MATRLLLPRAQRVNLDGRPLSGAKLFTYVTGTSTPKPVYTDPALTTPHANPVIADASGTWPSMYPEGGLYRLVLTDAADVVIYTDDDVEGATTNGTGGGSAVDARRNRIVNGAMQISQQNITNNVDATTGTNWTLDQWAAFLSTTPGGTLRVAQVASLTPGGSPFRLRATVQANDTSIAAGDFYTIAQPIEGSIVPDLRWGTASARQVLLRFMLRSSQAGTFGLSITNSAKNRSYVTLVTIAPGEINTDLLREIAIPGDTSGTWLTDTGVGMTIRFAMAAGTTFQGATGWQAGDIMSTSSANNFMATGSATLEISDVALYLDPDATGTFPDYEVPNFGDELVRCQRFYEKSYDFSVAPGTAASLNGALGIRTSAASVAQTIFATTFRTEKRVAPTVTFYSPVTGTANRLRNASGAADVTVTGAAADQPPGTSGIGGAAHAASFADGNIVTAHFVADARLAP